MQKKYSKSESHSSYIIVDGVNTAEWAQRMGTAEWARRNEDNRRKITSIVYWQILQDLPSHEAGKKCALKHLMTSLSLDNEILKGN